MELDELKSSWETLSRKMEKQQQLNSKLIEQMINQNYKHRLNNIARPEFIGSIICFIFAIALVYNFNTLNTLILQICGGFSILFLILLPLLSLRSIRGLQTINMTLSTYKNTLKEFAVKKIRFQKIQKLNVFLSFIFIISFAPVSVKLIAGKDISQNITLWLTVLPASVIVLFFVSKWVLRHYNNTLKKAEELLTEIDS
jgi:phosphatidylserine synthase